MTSRKLETTKVSGNTLASGCKIRGHRVDREEDAREKYLRQRDQVAEQHDGLLRLCDATHAKAETQEDRGAQEDQDRQLEHVADDGHLEQNERRRPAGRPPE